MGDIREFSDFYIVLYTNYRYLETVYENQLKFEATLYNPKTRKTLSPWNPVTNRIILGVFSFSVKNNEIVEVVEEDATIFFDESNVIKNGTFDDKNTNSWTAINSILKIENEGGALDTPYITITPMSAEYQGMAQVISTKPNDTYEVSFYVKSDETTPFQVLVLDKKSLYDLNATEVKSYDSTSTKKWVLHTFRFSAFSTQSTIFFLKKSNDLENKIDFDHIYVFEYTRTRKISDLNRVSLVDGGRIPTTENIIHDDVQRESFVYQWNFVSKSGKRCYEFDDTVPALKSPGKGHYLVFFGGTKLYEKDYYIDNTNNRIFFNAIIDKPNEDVSVFYIRKSPNGVYKWELEPSEIANVYAPDKYEENFQSKENGTYLVFYNAAKLHENDYSIDVNQNTIQLASEIINETSRTQHVTVFYITSPVVTKSWTFNTNVGVTTYYLSSSSEDFPDTTKGRYLVFLNGSRVVDDDFLINQNNNSISLDIIPDVNNAPLCIYYFGNEVEPNEVPEDENLDVYHWKLTLRTGQTLYSFDSSYQSLKSVSAGYYMLFKDGKKLLSSQYTINTASNSISLVSSVIAEDSVVDVYFVKNPAAGNYSWKFSTMTDVRTYTPTATETVFPSPDDGRYLVFLNDKKLTQEQFNILFTSNTIRLSNNLSVPQGASLQVYCFIDPPVRNKFWKFNTIKNVSTYIPQENQFPFSDLPDGEFLLFKNDIKLSEKEFEVNKLKNNLTFLTPPQENGGRIELYFLGKE